MAGQGSAPGERRGGRKKGTPNKATLATAALARQEAQQRGQKLGIDVMIEIMNYFAGLGAKYQPQFETDEQGKRTLVGGDEKKCGHYLKLAADIAKDVTQYQTPKLQSTTMRHDAPADPIKVVVEIV